MASKADPKVSAGARLERKAFRSYLRRKLAACEGTTISTGYTAALNWVLDRQRRYDQKAGGLGKAAR